MSQKEQGKIIAVCGFSASGKTTLTMGILKHFDNLKYLKTYTTREPRSQDEAESSLEYYFVTDKRYEALKARSKNWDHSCIYGNKYGVDVDQVKRMLKEGTNFIFNMSPDKLMLDDMELKYSQKILVIWNDVSWEICIERLKKERGEDEQNKRVDRSLESYECIRNRADFIFVPVLDISEDQRNFLNLVRGIVYSI